MKAKKGTGLFVYGVEITEDMLNKTYIKSTPAKSWSELFDKKFTVPYGASTSPTWDKRPTLDWKNHYCVDVVKSFISTTIAQAKQEARKETIKEVVGMIDEIAETEGKPKENKFYGVGESELAYKATVYIVCQMIKDHLKEQLEGK